MLLHSSLYHSSPAVNTERCAAAVASRESSELCFSSLQALLKKFNIAYWRTPEYNYIRALVTVILGFVLGTLYWKIGHKR